MKKKNRKLQLRRQVLRHLNPDQLGGVVGGTLVRDDGGEPATFTYFTKRLDDCHDDGGTIKR